MNLQNITQQYFNLFPGDFSENPAQRQTPKVLFAQVTPVGFDHPELLLFNEKLSNEIGLGRFEDQNLDFLVGNNLPQNIKTYATAYAGHQFGSWAGQLGDGRAIFAGEIENPKGNKTEIQWKGAGATPYSRFADGRAVLRSSVREYLMSEAMFHLGVPTTRALSLALTGEDVIRDIMYNGNARAEKGAVVIRTAESFLRFGHFELLSAQKETETLQKLTDFCIENYFPEIQSEGIQKYKDFFENVCQRTSDMIVEWYRVGFVHGVMNTDNMSVLGLTIDYGPFSMVDEFDLNFTPNTTDLPGRRYAFGNQAQISQWNLWQLANALYPLIQDEKFLEEVLNNYNQIFWEKHDTMLAKKFGFEKVLPEDEQFFVESQTLMQDLHLDYTLFYNELEDFENSSPKEILEKISYLPHSSQNEEKLKNFITKYSARLSKNGISRDEYLLLMRNANPKFTLRNYLLFECIEELENGERTLLEKLVKALEDPYTQLFSEFSQKRPSKYDGVAGCSMLSCSS